MQILSYEGVVVGCATNSLEGMALIYTFLEAAKTIEGLEVDINNFKFEPLVTGKLLVPEMAGFNDGKPLGMMQMFKAEKDYFAHKDVINKLIEVL